MMKPFHGKVGQRLLWRLKFPWDIFCLWNVISRHSILKGYWIFFWNNWLSKRKKVWVRTRKERPTFYSYNYQSLLDCTNGNEWPVIALDESWLCYTRKCIHCTDSSLIRIIRKRTAIVHKCSFLLQSGSRPAGRFVSDMGYCRCNWCELLAKH